MRSTPILAVLLAASLLVNVGLALRSSRGPGSERSTARAPGPSEPRPAGRDEAASLRESLDLERKRNADLLARIERLETDKTVLAQEAPGASKPDKLAAFREKLRRLMKVMKDPAAKSGSIDPDAMVEVTDTMMEFLKLSAIRSKEPKTYAGYLHAFYEVGLEGEGTSLTPAQSAELSTVLGAFGEDLSRIPPTPAGERLLKELELEGAMMSRVRGVLTEAQRTALSAENLDMLAAGNLMSTAYVSKQGAADQIAKQWSTIYQLDAAQLPQAKLAAQAYVDAVSRFEGGSLAARNGSPESYERRIASAREQLAALNVLQASMTPAQQERLRTQAMREILILDGVAPVEAAPPEK